MMTFSNVTRRGFLRALVWFSFFGVNPSPRSPRKINASPALDPLAFSLADVFGQRESAEAVGLEYLGCVPQESDASLLVDLICSRSVQRRAELSRANRVELRELVRLQQRDDFDHGRVVNLQGWILSETEVRLCALAALI